MPTSHRSLHSSTDASTVAELFSSQVSGKVILITGVNSKGLGGATAKAFAPHSPKALILASRTLSKIDETIEDLQSEYPDTQYHKIVVDFSSQESCRRAANEILDNTDIPHIDIMINNAAVMNIPTRTLSVDGIELHLATNHVSHFLFTNILMPKLLLAANHSLQGSTRVVNVSALASSFQPFRFSDVNFEKQSTSLPKSEQPNIAVMGAYGYTEEKDKKYTPILAYAQSKTANILFARGLTQKLYDEYSIQSCSVHPGMIITELPQELRIETVKKLERDLTEKGMQFKTLNQGANSQVLAALDPALGPSVDDLYLEDCQTKRAPAWTTDLGISDKLWKKSEELVGQKFAW
ncbi:hypothetical protein B7463_g2090, partial [Scytalidium lignicola]